ncbi:MAG: PD40 domain-containing protein [Planctomycetes bacterium]|nr:PD40 domain-containing protein [Planctomycetota bacterium]
MQLKRNIAILAVAALVFTSPAWGQSASTLLQEGIFIEETVGDLDAAIEIYERIAASAEKDRTYAALAQYRLGMCYLKKGLKQDAAVAFRKLIDRFPMQTERVAQAKVQLAALGQPSSAMVTRQVWSPALDMMGTVSPDGRYFSYVNWTKGNLAVHDFKTGEDRDLTDEGTWETPNKFCDVSIWSPDSQQIAYYWIDRGTEGEQLRIVGIDGSKPRVLTSSNVDLGAAAFSAPATPWPREWSADGKYILALVAEKNEKLERGHEDHIVLVTVADGSVRYLKSLGEEHSKRHTKNMSLSPDGRYVAYELQEKHGSDKNDIYLLATDGSGESVLVEHPANDWAPYWTPDGNGIVFVSDRSGSTGLWMLNVEDGKPMGTPTQIKETSDRFYPKGFASNGSFYYGVGKPDSDVYVAALDFETGRMLAPPTKTALRFEGTNLAPTWSPDGKYLAYASRRSSQESYTLVIKSVETGQERDLSPKSLVMGAAQAYGRPRWSPDGRSILVVGRVKDAPSRNNGLYLVDVQTEDFTTLVQDGPEKDPSTAGPRYHVFSNNGKQINYVRGQSIMTFDLKTRQESELYKAETNIYMLACSPDGRQLAFCESSEAVFPNVVMTIPASGGEPRELLRVPEGKTFPWGVGISWTPDGRHVVVGRPGASDQPDELWIIPATGGELRKLTLEFNVRKLSLHPDGRRIAFGQRFADGGDIWVMENFLPVDQSVSHN